MSTIDELKNTKNLVNFEMLITLVESYGSAYQPLNPMLRIESLQAKAANAHAAITHLNDLLPVYNKAIALREVAFEPLVKLRVRLFSLLQNRSNMQPKTYQLQVVQVYFDGILASLQQQIQLMQTISAEAPNHAELQLPSLKLLYDELKAKNEIAISQTVLLHQAQLICNEIIYHAELGLVTIGLQAKRYIQSLYSQKNFNYKQVSLLEFNY